MKRVFMVLTVLGIVSLGWYWRLESLTNRSALRGSTTKVVRQPMTVWSTYEGRLEPRAAAMVMSKFHGTPTVIDLAPEGAKFSRGDVLARLDAAEVEREIVKLEKDYALAESELSSLKNAKAPLELRELTMKLTETRSSLKAEESDLRASIDLAKERLVSEQEIEQQREKVAGIKAQLLNLELRLNATKEYLQPAELKRGEARLAAAQQELQLAREQLRNSIIRAPSDGVVVYTPLHFGAELRTVRIGDTIYENQPFMMLPDMKDLVAECELPEGELAKAQEGQEAFVQPAAYSRLRLRGVVEKISPMARNIPDRPVWQKFFRVVIRLIDTDPRLRPGMAVTAHILSYHNPSALVVTRAAVRWESGKPFATVATGSSGEGRELTLGKANEQYYEVVKGLRLGV